MMKLFGPRFYVSLTAVCLLALLLTSSRAQAPQLRIITLDVGQGDSTLIIGPTGRTLLFDAGPTGAGAHIKSVVNANGFASLDYFIAGHYHSDHIGGIDELIAGGVPINQAVYDRGFSYDSSSYRDYVKAVGGKRHTMALDQVIDLGGGCSVTCILVSGRADAGAVDPQDDETGYSIGLLLRYGNFTYYLASDATSGGCSNVCPSADTETLVAARIGRVDAMHVQHHGSSDATGQGLLDALQPKVVFISCGTDNSSFHPAQSTLDRLQATSSIAHIWQTERGSGASAAKVLVGSDITLLTDGVTVNVSGSKTVITDSFAATSGASLLATVNAATFSPNFTVAPESIAALFGSGLATQTVSASSQPLPTTLAGVSITVNHVPAPLFFISPNQANYLIPADTPVGTASLLITNGDGMTRTGKINVAGVAPGIFTYTQDGRGLPIAVTTFDGIVFESVGNADGTPHPIDPGTETRPNYLVLFGTGLRGSSGLSQFQVRVGGLPAAVVYAGPQTNFAGLDQINIAIPVSLAGAGQAEVAIIVDGRQANTTAITIR